MPQFETRGEAKCQWTNYPLHGETANEAVCPYSTKLHPVGLRRFCPAQCTCSRVRLPDMPGQNQAYRHRRSTQASGTGWLRCYVTHAHLFIKLNMWIKSGSILCYRRFPNSTTVQRQICALPNTKQQELPPTTLHCKKIRIRTPSPG
jgi:hypothetical protein